MDLALVRIEVRPDGIFGELRDVSGDLIVNTLEHAYPDGLGSFTAKIPVGKYICVRGIHQLEGMSLTFETFEVTNVPGHSNILFHVGNFNKDSAGCILVGMSIMKTAGAQILGASKIAFDTFMDQQEGCNSFTLVVS